VVTWAQRGRGLTSELKGGNQARIKAAESDRMIGRAERLLPAGHGRVTVRGDSGFYAVELTTGCRKRRMRFTFSATRTSLMWSQLAEIDEAAWADAIEMRGAQVAEVPLTPEGWKHERLRLILRRVPVTAAELLAGSPKARRRAARRQPEGETPQDDPARAAADGARRAARLDLRLLLHRHRSVVPHLSSNASGQNVPALLFIMRLCKTPVVDLPALATLGARLRHTAS
jgi:hypothetical protein